MTAPDSDRKAPQYLVDTDARVQAFWAEFCQHAALPVSTPYQAWHFGDSPELARELGLLVVRGAKRATTSLGWTIDRHPELSAIPNGYSVITEFDGDPLGVIRTISIERCAFQDVDTQYAWLEGEGDRSLDSWRADHWEYFSRECAAIGCEPSADMPVVLECFELLYPATAARV